MLQRPFQLSLSIILSAALVFQSGCTPRQYERHDVLLKRIDELGVSAAERDAVGDKSAGALKPEDFTKGTPPKSYAEFVARFKEKTGAEWKQARATLLFVLSSMEGTKLSLETGIPAWKQKAADAKAKMPDAAGPIIAEILPLLDTLDAESKKFLDNTKAIQKHFIGAANDIRAFVGGVDELEKITDPVQGEQFAKNLIGKQKPLVDKLGALKKDFGNNQIQELETVKNALLDKAEKVKTLFDKLEKLGGTAAELAQEGRTQVEKLQEKVLDAATVVMSAASVAYTTFEALVAIGVPPPVALVIALIAALLSLFKGFGKGGKDGGKSSNKGELATKNPAGHKMGEEQKAPEKGGQLEKNAPAQSQTATNVRVEGSVTGKYTLWVYENGKTIGFVVNDGNETRKMELQPPVGVAPTSEAAMTYNALRDPLKQVKVVDVEFYGNAGLRVYIENVVPQARVCVERTESGTRSFIPN